MHMRPRAEKKADLEKRMSLARRRLLRDGFTLIEILAVMAILALIMVSLFTMFYQGTETWRLSSARTEAYLKARQILEMMAREIKGAVVITAPCGPRAGDEPSRADFRGFSHRVRLPHWRDSSRGEGIEQGYSDQVYFVAPTGEFWKQQFCMIGYWVKDLRQDTKDPDPLSGSNVPGNSKDDILMRYCVFEQGATQWGDNWFDFSKTPGAGINENHEVALSVRRLEIKYYDYDDTGRLIPSKRYYDAWDSRPSNYPGDADQKGTTSTEDDDNKLPVAVRITVIVGDKDDIIKGIKLSRIVYLDNARRAEPSVPR